MLEVQGVVVDIIFRNEDNYYTVLKLDTSDGLITAVGKLVSVSIGDSIEVSGDLVYHNQYGDQLSISKYRIKMPTTIVQVEKYLASGIFPFIGKKTAKEIVKMYGENTLDIITADKSALLKVKGLGKKRVDRIHKILLEELESREILIYLQGLGLGNKTASLIYKTYKERAIEVIKENPYALIDDIKGIGFKIADEIALKNKVDKTDLFRISAGVVYYLDLEAMSNGNCYIEKGQMLSEVARLLEIDPSFVESALVQLEITGKIKLVERDGIKAVYAGNIYEKEQNIVSNILRLTLDHQIETSDIELDLEEKEGFSYSEKQKEAILEAIYKKILIITGGPGTGKTTIIKGVIDLLSKMGQSYYLCAPTGRAVKRMEESTGQKASTIHRLLGFKGLEKEDIRPEYNKDNPLPVDVIIVDEVSMIDIFLMSDLVEAIDDLSRLILVGDVDQLPSVGPGNVLKDLIESRFITTVQLDTIFRQGESSNIVKNAHLINGGRLPILNEKDKDFFFIKTRNDDESLNTILDLASTRLPSYYNIDPMKDIQVLSAMKKGVCGVENLNKTLQDRINPAGAGKEEIENARFTFREGDKVMQVKNDYDLEMKDQFGNVQKGVYNGDIGFIRNSFKDDGELEVIIDEKKVSYNYKAMSELSLAYAITIHKSQGSEFPVVIIPMVQGPYMLLSRNILYTAITRAKKLVVLVGDINIMRRMIDNNFRQNRNSSLAYYLRKNYQFFEDDDS